MKKYEALEHSADLRIKVCADSMRGLFEAAAEGIMSEVLENGYAGKPAIKRVIFIEGSSREELLVKFLNELLYLFYGKKLAAFIGPGTGFAGFGIAGNALKAEAFFAKIENFSAKAEIKAVTYGGIEIKWRIICTKQR